MDKLMPKTMGIARPVRVLVIETMDGLMRVEHNVWTTNYQCGGMIQHHGWYTRKTVDIPLEEPSW
jgi:hypothetical protein